MGRPKKAPKDRKTRSIRVPLTRAEQEAIEAGAAAAGKKIVAFVREAAVRASKRLE